MKFDAFDEILINENVTEEEWDAYYKILDIKKKVFSKEERRLIINDAFRKYYGNSLANVVLKRNEFEPDYEEPILKAALHFFYFNDDIKIEEMSVLEKEKLVYENLMGDNYVNNNIATLTDDIIKRAKSKVNTIVNVLVSGGVGTIAARLFSLPLGVAATANQLLFETNWKKVMATIALTYKIRKRLNDEKFPLLPQRLYSNGEISIDFEKVPDSTGFVVGDEFVEITNSNIKEHLIALMPEALRLTDNVSNVKYFDNLIKDGGIYTAILKGNRELVKSREVDGAVRGFTRNRKGIDEQANWIKVDGLEDLKTSAILNSVMGTVSIVVGQYYMAHIDRKLSDLQTMIEDISSYQRNEYISQVKSLVLDCYTFEFNKEDMEDREICKANINNLEENFEKGSQLLIQANDMIKDLIGKDVIDSKDYETRVYKLQVWTTYQKVLLTILEGLKSIIATLDIDERSTCNKRYGILFNETYGVLDKLNLWHKQVIEQIQISLKSGKIKREDWLGTWNELNEKFSEFLSKKVDFPQFNVNIRNSYNDMKYIPVRNKNLIQYIKEQINAKDTVKNQGRTVKLMFKDNKIYCNTNLLQS